MNISYAIKEVQDIIDSGNLSEMQSDALKTSLKSLQYWNDLQTRIDKLDWYDDKPGEDAKVLVFDVQGVIDRYIEMITRS
jgi:hypothetical protein